MAMMAIPAVERMKAVAKARAESCSEPEESPSPPLAPPAVFSFIIFAIGVCVTVLAITEMVGVATVTTPFMVIFILVFLLFLWAGRYFSIVD